MKLLTPFETMSPRDLGKLLHAQSTGFQRPHSSADLLAQALSEGEVVADSISLPWRPTLDECLIDALLADETIRRIETSAHRTLKVHARLLAFAADSHVVLEPEAPATVDRFPLRADLIAWSPYGTSSTFECGSVDGRSVLAQLGAGHLRVTVLPFVGLGTDGIVGFSFRRADNSPFPYISVAQALDTWQYLRLRADAAAFDAAFM
jgi:hypothetical protein